MNLSTHDKIEMHGTKVSQNPYPGYRPKVYMSNTPWSGSTRRNTLPRDWADIRTRVRARAGGQCEAPLNDASRCTNTGTDCDHIVPGNNHDLSNLQWLCKWHHNRKSSAEGKAAQKPRYTERHPRERHPGLN